MAVRGEVTGVYNRGVRLVETSAALRTDITFSEYEYNPSTWSIPTDHNQFFNDFRICAGLHAFGVFGDT